MMWAVASILLVLTFVSSTPNCVTREFPAGTVCVCNATHCDDIEPLDGFIPPGTAILYQTNNKGARMDKSTLKQTPNPVHLTIEIDPSTTFQDIIGFGGAMTDAVGVNLIALSKATQDTLIKQYYGPSGTEYTLTRVPMAASDFSLRIYTYDDNQVGEDFNMTNFALANDDYQFKIPYLKQAMDLQKDNGGLRLFAAPWTPPVWMKNDPIFKGNALLQGEQDGPYYASYAKYFVKFFEAYLKEGLPFWAVSLQNEPSDWQTIFPTATYQSNFIKNHLASALRSSAATQNIKIMGLEDQRVYLPEWIDEFANDKDALALLDGISVHWYADHSKPASVLSQVHEKYPEKFILYTEACNGSPTSGSAGPSLGNFTSGESYAHSIIEDLNNWVSGWVDWNLALNTQGGYSWFMNFVDSPIIVETNVNEFLKQPMYYLMAHFSKFLKPGAKVVKLSLPQLPEKVEAIGAVMVDGNRYITILNRNDNEDVTVSLHEKGVGSVYTTVSVPAHSLATRHNLSKPTLNMLRILLLTSFFGVVLTQGCAKRELPTGIVCVCNATYCDVIDPPGELMDNQAVIYVTNIGGARLDRTIVQKTSLKTDLVFSFDPSQEYQELLGFGGSFTDATGINLLSLSENTRSNLMRSYFGSSGSEYTLGRVPIASTDFSPRPYSYAEVKGDFGLDNFSLVEEDYKYKLPFIKEAMELQRNIGGMRLVAAPWSAPAWMKSNNIMTGGGKLRGFEGGPYYVAWADYFVKFFEAYSSEAVDFWAVEVQNEPRCGADSKYKWQSMYFSPEMEANFVVNQLSPALKNNSVTRNLNIIGMTDQRGALPDWVQRMFANEAALSLTDGISVHWYEDDFKSPDLLLHTYQEYPDKFILASEASNGFMDPHQIRMRPGDYSRAEKYVHSVIEDLNSFVGGWIDWNLALDLTGGPSWVNNYLDSTILVNAADDEFFKQPSYYALAHFSKFLKPCSRRVRMEIMGRVDKKIEAVAAVNADGRRVIVAMNTDKDEAVRLSVVDKSREGNINITLEPRSIVTILWN